MPLKIASALSLIAPYVAAVGIFLSVSVVGLYQALVFLAFLALLFSSQSIRTIKYPPSFYALLVFFIFNILSLILNYGDLRNGNAGFGYTHLFAVGLMVTVLLAVFGSQEKFQKNTTRAFAIFLVTVILAFFNGAAQMFLGFDLATLSRVEPIERMAGFTDIMRYGYGSGLVVLGISAFLILNPGVLKIRLGKLAVFALISALLGVYFAYTRGALLGLLVALPLMFCFYKRKLALAAGASSLAIIGMIVFISFSGGSDSNRLAQRADSASNTIRLSQFAAAYYMFTEKPLLGWGPKQYAYYVKDFKEKYDLAHKEYYGFHSHNIFLETLSTTGMLGFLALLSWLGLWFIEVIQGGRMTRFIYLPVLVYIGITGMFEMLFMAQTTTMIMLMYAVHASGFYKVNPASARVFEKAE